MVAAEFGPAFSQTFVRSRAQRLAFGANVRVRPLAGARSISMPNLPCKAAPQCNGGSSSGESRINSAPVDQEEQAQPSKAIAKESNDLSMLESQVRKRGQKGKRNQGPKVEAPVVDEVYGKKPQSEASQLEATAIRVLFVLFSIVLLEGIFLAASGFLSEGLDDFAQNVVYPAFTPTLGVFLACSTLYGLWKSRQG